MSKAVFFIILILILSGLGYLVYMRNTAVPGLVRNPVQSQPTPTPTETPKPFTFDFSNSASQIDKSGQTSITNQTANPTGNRAAAIVVDQPGGSGTFYYLVGGMIIHGQATFSQPRSLGDRVKITSVKVDDPGANDNGVITVQYLDRPNNAPMSQEPNVSVTKKFAFQDDGNLIEVLH